MGLFDFAKNQLRSVIEWNNPEPDALYHKWTDRGDEIKNASKLIVNPGQGVIFVYQGKIQAIHTEAGTYDLQTGNIPFWTTISRVMQAFESEYKVGIYFVRMTEFVNQKWGTKGPIKYLDPLYKFPVGLRAFGNFSFRIDAPENFFVNVVGTQENVSINDVSRIIGDRIIQPLTDTLAEANFGYVEVDKQRDELAESVKTKITQDVATLGFVLTDFRIENTDFDEDTQRRIGEMSDIMAQGQAAQAVGINYVELQKVQAMRDAAKNEGGLAGMGIGVGAGLGFGQMMAGSFQAGPQTTAPQNTPTASLADRLAQLKQMHDAQLISDSEFETKKNEILSQL